jgi:hypothetical protein
MIHGGGTFKGCEPDEVCWECRDLLRGFKNGEELPNYIMVHDFRGHTKGHECYKTLTQWYTHEGSFGSEYLPYENIFRFIMRKEVTLLFKKKKTITLPLNISVSFSLAHGGLDEPAACKGSVLDNNGDSL